MRKLSMEDTADYLENATITETQNIGHAVIHMGLNTTGGQFVIINDAQGNTTLTEAP